MYHFLEGLKPELQMEVLKTKPQTLAEAVETAKEFDAPLVRANTFVPSEPTTGAYQQARGTSEQTGWQFRNKRYHRKAAKTRTSDSRQDGIVDY